MRIHFSSSSLLTFTTRSFLSLSLHQNFPHNLPPLSDRRTLRYLLFFSVVLDQSVVLYTATSASDMSFAVYLKSGEQVKVNGRLRITLLNPIFTSGPPFFLLYYRSRLLFTHLVSERRYTLFSGPHYAIPSPRRCTQRGGGEELSLYPRPSSLVLSTERCE